MCLTCAEAEPKLRCLSTGKHVQFAGDAPAKRTD